ncbi:hypothetical protein HPP92_020137 [Vanilla planifolia]|uniref:E3 ubiquitin ligase UBR4 C-terminal domain-containing protein n=1 Tax=Vanilla planifolia TaxID=51239 RepID=A0A835Q737_VANPL|nr:hypothetical protein HPP92_020137 [Vanilla planifolia]
MYHAYMQHRYGRSALRFPDAAAPLSRTYECSSADTDDSHKVFGVLQPMLVYTGLIEQLQRFFKLSKGAKETGDGLSGGIERWEVTMKEKLLDVKEMVSFAKELLSWLEDMTSAADLQEAFDVMGALGDALSGYDN